MTNEEFNKLTRQAWKQYPIITADVMQELQDVYLEAAELAKAEVLRAEREGLSELTVQSKNAISQQLDRGVGIINDATNKALAQGVEGVLSIEDSITNAWLLDATKEAGVGASVITSKGLEALNLIVREQVLAITVSRQFADNYTLSERVWESASLYKTDMNRVINLGLAQGKDNIKIAEAMSDYIKGGREALTRAKTYGKISRGNGRLYSRISKNADWRALRLIRSEEYMSLQAAAVQRGENNPGSTGLYNWVENDFVFFPCECPSLAANSPYTAEEIPSYPHPNCLCTIEQILRDQQEFVEDLVKWTKGESVPYIDKWYTEKYQLNT